MFTHETELHVIQFLYKKRVQTSVPRAGFKPVIPMFRRPKALRGQHDELFSTGYEEVQ